LQVFEASKASKAAVGSSREYAIEDVPGLDVADVLEPDRLLEVPPGRPVGGVQIDLSPHQRRREQLRRIPREPDNDDLAAIADVLGRLRDVAVVAGGVEDDVHPDAVRDGVYVDGVYEDLIRVGAVAVQPGDGDVLADVWPGVLTLEAVLAVLDRLLDDVGALGKALDVFAHLGDRRGVLLAHDPRNRDELVAALVQVRVDISRRARRFRRPGGGGPRRARAYPVLGFRFPGPVWRIACMGVVFR
jgi:hypothetical protein